MTTTNARITITATALEPIIHGEGTRGNTTIARRQTILDAEGRKVRVPYLSGNSIKHQIREASVRFAVEVLGTPRMSKSLVNLLISGGALTKSGTAVSLEGARRLSELFPALSLCGYAAGNEMRESKLRVDHWHVVCQENAWRMPASLRQHPHTRLRAGTLIEESFLTRHDPARGVIGQLLLAGDEMARLESEASTPAAQTSKREKADDSQQMIADTEQIVPGTVLWSTWEVRDATDMEMAAFRAGISRACLGVHDQETGELLFRVGAKGSTGHGLVAIRFDGALRRAVQAPTYDEADGLVRFGATGDAGIDGYVRHLQERREEIVSYLEEVAA